MERPSSRRQTASSVPAPEIRARYFARELRISSAVLVQVKGRGFSFQVSIQCRMSASRAWTLVWTPRRMSLSVMQAEQAFDLVDPGGSGRGEVDVEPGVAGQPGVDLGGLVGGVVVADEVDVELGGDGLVDGDQELAELDRAVPAVQVGDHVAVGDVERREQAGDAVADVVVGAPLGHAGHHRQHRLGAVQRLDLGLLVDAQHDRLLRRVVVEADDVDDLLHEQRVGGQLEPVLEMGFEVELPPDPPDRRR